MASAVLSLAAMGVITASAGQVKIFAGARFDSKAWAKLQRFDVRNCVSQSPRPASPDALRSGSARPAVKFEPANARAKEWALDANVGRLVELHFQFRAKELRHLKPNWYQASVWQAAPEERRGFVSVPVMIAAADLNSFLSFTTDHRATTDLKIYGQVLYDIGINYTFVRVIGTNTFVDSEGYTNVTW